MSTTSKVEDLVAIGLAAADVPLRQQVKLWARYSDEKSDVASDMMIAVRRLIRDGPADRALRSLSIGSSDEPQFRLLQAVCDGGIWLYDADRGALEIVRERVRRQMLSAVNLVEGDLTKDFVSYEPARELRATRLGDASFDLILLHHVLYYCETRTWPEIIATLYRELLRAPGAIHIALMSASTPEPHTTTWLYNHFTQTFFGQRNTQSVAALEGALATRPDFDGAHFALRTVPSYFWCNDFAHFMAVVWMIMLYPDGHRYTLDQRREIVDFVIAEFWIPKQRLKQNQDYLTVFKPAA